jgi:hypothetical protein
LSQRSRHAPAIAIAMALVQPSFKKDDDFDDGCELLTPSQI